MKYLRKVAIIQPKNVPVKNKIQKCQQMSQSNVNILSYESYDSYFIFGQLFGSYFGARTWISLFDLHELKC